MLVTGGVKSLTLIYSFIVSIMQNVSNPIFPVVTSRHSCYDIHENHEQCQI